MNSSCTNIKRAVAGAIFTLKLLDTSTFLTSNIFLTIKLLDISTPLASNQFLNIALFYYFNGN